MNKLFTKIATAFVGMAMAIGVGVAVGSKKEAVPVHATSGNWSVSLTAAPAGVTNATNSNITLNGMAWTVNIKKSGTNSSRWQLSTNDEYGNSTLTSTAYTDPISSISIGWYTNSKITVNWACSVGSTSLDETLGNTSSTDSGTKTFDFSSTKPTGTIILAATSATGGYGLTSISIVSGATTKMISVGSNTASTNVGMSSSVTVSYANLTSNITVAQASNNGGALTLDSSITISGSGTGDTSLSFTGASAGTVTVTLTSDTASATVTVTVTNYTVYTKLTSDAQIYDGLTIVLTNNGYLASEFTTSSSNKFLTSTAGITGTNTIAHASPLEFTISGTIEDGWTLTNASGALGITSANNNRLAWDDGTTTWSITYNTSTNLFRITNSGSGYGSLQYNYNNGSPRISNYTTSNQTDLALFAKAATNNIYAFIGSYMHMGDTNLWDAESGDELGLCTSGGYYTTAKTAFNALDEDDRVAFFNESNTQYAAARQRLTAWAAANGESFNTTDSILKAANVGLLFVTNKDNSSATTIIIIVSMVSLTAIAGYAILRKRKAQ